MKYLSRVLLAFSILINTILGGDTNQSFSARNWSWKKAQRFNMVWLIDKIFWWEQNHCQEAWIKWTIINTAIVNYMNKFRE